MVFISLVKAKRSPRLLITEPDDTEHLFELTDVDGPAKVLRRYVHAEYPIQCSSSVNHSDEYGAPDFNYDAHMEKVYEAIGPSEKMLATWATLAVAAARLGIDIPEAATKKLVEAGFFTQEGPETFVTGKTREAVTELVKKYLGG